MSVRFGLWSDWPDRPERAGVFVDFDGTLAPIVNDYDQARPRPEAARLLSALARRYALVAVISGRPLAYLQLHLGEATGTELVGLYGLERARRGGDEAEQVPAAEQWRAAVEAAAAAAEAQAPDGVVVERKGLAVTLHFRAAPERAAWVERFAAGEVAARGLAAHPGKMSVELRPPVRTDKGTVIAELGADLEAVCFIGDDRGDLPGFEALRLMRSEGKSTLAVAVAGPETPVELLDSADLVVAGPEGVIALLEVLAAGQPRLP